MLRFSIPRTMLNEQKYLLALRHARRGPCPGTNRAEASSQLTAWRGSYTSKDAKAECPQHLESLNDKTFAKEQSYGVS